MIFIFGLNLSIRQSSRGVGRRFHTRWLRYVLKTMTLANYGVCDLEDAGVIDIMTDLKVKASSPTSASTHPFFLPQCPLLRNINNSSKMPSCNKKAHGSIPAKGETWQQATSRFSMKQLINNLLLQTRFDSIIRNVNHLSIRPPFTQLTFLNLAQECQLDFPLFSPLTWEWNIP